MPCVPECSHGGNCHLGTAHSDPAQGEFLYLYNPPLPLFLPVLYTLRHHNPDVRLFHFFPPSLFTHCQCSWPLYQPSAFCTEWASCGSRMCGNETIVSEPRWQETMLRKTEISVCFLTTSFHLLPGATYSSL